MSNNYKLAAILSAAALFAGQGAVSAATVYPDKGAVLVNNGDGFNRISGETYVGAGGQVMTKHGGGATIIYNDKCKVHVHPGEVKVVQEGAPCGGAAASDEGSPFLLAGAAGLVGVGIGMAIAHDGHDDHGAQRKDTPASP
jgi:hypothetical protein